MVVVVLLFTTPSLGVATVADNTGLVPTAAFSGVIGTNTVVLAPLVMVAELVQDTNVPAVEQVKPLLVNVAGAVTLFGMLRVKVTGPEVGAVPMLLKLTGTVLVCPATSTGAG